MGKNARKFELEIKTEWLSQKEAINDKIKEIVLFCLGGVIFKSPVGNPSLWQSPAPKGYVGGRLRGSWGVSVGSPTTPLENIDPTGQSAFTDGQTALSSYPEEGFPAIYIQNPMPYASAIENGWSSQAPRGMVALTIAEAEQFFDGDKI